MIIRHSEKHNLTSMGWLRAAVLGANDGIVSTSSLILGVAASHATLSTILIAGVAGLVSGAISMAAGEYISVQSQADTEEAALKLESRELKDDPESELQELTEIYVARGLELPLAGQVAKQLMEHDALQAHARDELGITETLSARPLQAAVASACSFAIGALLPLLVTAIVPMTYLFALIAGTSLIFLAFLGGIAAHIGGADIKKGILRVTFWSALAMGATSIIGSLFGTVL